MKIEKPLHQRLIIYVTWTLTGALALGSFLDAVGNAIGWITTSIALVGNILILLAVIGIQLYLRYYPLDWVIDGKRVRIAKLNLRLVLPLVGMMLLLWIPLLTQNEIFTPCGIPEVPKNKSLILIAKFHRGEGLPDAEIHNEIRRRINEIIENENFQEIAVAVEPTELLIGQREEAIKLGTRCSASIIIWGSESSVRIETNFLNLKDVDIRTSKFTITETERTFRSQKKELSAPDPYGEFVTKQLPDHLAFLALFSVGQSYFLKSDFGTSLNLTEKAIESLKSDVQPQGLDIAYNYLGWLYLVERNENERAITAFNRAIALNQNDAATYNNLGWIYYDLGQPTLAFENFNKSIELLSNNPLAYNGRAALRIGLKEYDAAIADAKKALSVAPNYEPAYETLAYAYYESQESELAFDLFKKAIERFPNEAGLYASRGYFYLTSLKIPEAIVDFQQAITLEPENPLFYLGRGTAYAQDFEYDRAIEDFTTAIDFDANFGLAYFERGSARFKNFENSQGWDEDVKVALTYPMDPQTTIRILDFLCMAYVAENKPQTALEYCNRLVNLSADPTRRDGRGAAYTLLGHYTEAVADLKTAVLAQESDIIQSIAQGSAVENRLMMVAYWKPLLIELEKGNNPFTSDALRMLRAAIISDF